VIEQVTLSWGVPSTSASAPITDYIIETSNDDGVTWEVFDDGDVNILRQQRLQHMVLMVMVLACRLKMARHIASESKGSSRVGEW